MYQGITRKSTNSLKKTFWLKLFLPSRRSTNISLQCPVRFRELSEAFMSNLGNVSMHQTNHNRITNHFKFHGKDTFSRKTNNISGFKLGKRAETTAVLQ